jgi:hypothetical protein
MGWDAWGYHGTNSREDNRSQRTVKPMVEDMYARVRDTPG